MRMRERLKYHQDWYKYYMECVSIFTAAGLPSSIMRAQRSADKHQAAIDHMLEGANDNQLRSSGTPLVTQPD